MFCTNCGKELNPGDRFCANCGCEIKASQTEKRKYDNVVFNPPFRMEADKRTAQILSNRGEFNGFKEIAKENSQRNTRSKAKMDWNLDGFPESVTARNKSGFDWGSVVERRNSGRSMGPEKIDLSATIEHKKVDDTQIGANKAETSGKDNLGLPPEDSRVISLEELEKELYDLEEDLKSDTAGTNQYQAFDPQDDDELDAYLDGLPKTKKKEKDAEEEKLEAEALAAVKMGGPMKWNLTDDAPRGSKVSKAPMGLVWGIDPDEVAAKRKAAKVAAKKETVMVWDTDSKAEEKKAAPEPAAEEPAAAETVQAAEPVQPEPAVEPEPIKEPAGFAVPEHHQAAEPEYEPFEIPEFKPFVMPVTEVKEEPAPEEPVHAEPEPVAEPEPAAEPEPETAEPEKPSFEPEVPFWTEETVKEESAPETEVEDEFNDMLLHEGDDDLEKTRMIDHSEIKKMLDEYKKKLEEEEPETQDEPAEEIFAAEEPAEEKQEEAPAVEAGMAAAAGRVLYQEDLIHPWEKVAEEEAAPSEEVQEGAEEEVAETEEPAPETAEETETPETEEPAEEEPETAEEPVEEEPAEEESSEEEHSEEEPAEEIPEENEAPAEDESLETPEAAEAPAEEKPMFYTFSRQNDAFQQLLQKERDRLNGLGTEYVPLNAETKIEKFVNAEDKPAYEENGVFVEGIVQPSHVPAADMSGDAVSETSKQKFITDGDWLRELRSAKDIDSLNKTKLRYSDLFPTPAPASDEKEYGPADDEESLKEKQKKAEELNRIFEEEEQEEKKGKKGKKDKEDKGPKKHIVGNIIMILLILLILFEGSVLAAKLIAPDSKYAHISDSVVEKVMNLISGEKDSEPVDADAAEETDIEDISIEDTAYMTMIDNLSKEAKTIGQVVYNDDLNYSLVEKSGFEGVESMNTLTDSEWTKDGDTSITYAGGIFASVINYYDEWKSRNTNEDLVGIDSLELGEIKQGEDGYYILTKTTYAAKDGSKAISYQTSHVTIMDGTMFIDEIKGETVNG